MPFMRKLFPLIILVSFTLSVQRLHSENATKGDNIGAEFFNSNNDSLPQLTTTNAWSDNLMKNELLKNLFNGKPRSLSTIVLGMITEGFSAFDLLENLQPSECLQVCLEEVTSMLEQPFVGQRSIDEVGNICSHFDVFQRCLHHNTSCKDSLLAITTMVIHYLCNANQEVLENTLPCLYNHATVIYFTCDNECDLGKIVSGAAIERKSIPESKESKVPNFYELCSASSCFINCIQQKVRRECSLGRLSLLQRAVTEVINHTIKTNPMPQMKSSDAYTLLVSSILPQECHRLELNSGDEIYNLSTADFADMEYKNSDADMYIKKNDGIKTIVDSYTTNQTPSIYVQTFPLNGHQMKLQCQIIDLETGQAASATNVTAFMSTAIEGIFQQFGLRSVEMEQTPKRAKKILTSHKTSNGEVYVKASLCDSLMMISLSLLLKSIVWMD
ncbi:unnamed protein product [Thelazia callipaeda]|uniref:CPG4 domain-containing protein n=1 Tax=Thelazia callipaeda TaxID=103827 RepID=A0A0N5CJ85_THECL|nr:unnamed protein product [Thelazia callipaeda]